MPLFIKKPVTVEAVQFTESSLPQVRAMDKGGQIVETDTPGELRINTPEGQMTAYTGDWIIQGVKGELYPCRDDIFQMTYEDPRERELPQAPPPRIEPGYERLASVFQAALDQAQRGKGKERHANDLPFHEQRMQALSDALNSAKGMAYQACKKVTEGVDHPTYEQQERELLGAIVYIGGMIVWLQRRRGV